MSYNHETKPGDLYNLFCQTNNQIAPKDDMHQDDGGAGATKNEVSEASGINKDVAINMELEYDDEVGLVQKVSSQKLDAFEGNQKNHDSTIDNAPTKKQKPILENQASVPEYVRILSPKKRKSAGLNIVCSISVRLRLIFYLVLLGATAGPIELGIREYFSELPDSVFLAFCAWTLTALFLVMFAIVWTDKLQPIAAGSGLPEVKAILSGGEIENYLTIKAFLAKVFGLVAAAGSGLSIGREGPFVHITCIIANQLLRIPIFKPFAENKGYTLQFIAAAAAVGVATNFSAPLGGVLFSIEVTATYYLLSNYWKSFLSAISAAVFTTLLRVWFLGDEGFHKLFQTTYPLSPYDLSEIPFFFLIGAFMGSAGALLIRMYKMISIWMKEEATSRKLTIRIVIPVVVAVFTSIVTFWPGEFMRHSLTENMGILLSQEELPEYWTKDYSAYVSLLIFSASYFLLTPISIALALPAGAFIPTFVVGAALGRLFGMFLRDHLFLSDNYQIYPGAYALMGGASMAGGVSRTISAAVIALEITGQHSLLLPVFIAVLSANGMGSLLSESLFDVILRIRKIPYLPMLRFDRNKRAMEVMNPEVLKIERQTTYMHILVILNLINQKSVPVVDNQVNLLLLGVVSKRALVKIMKQFYEDNNLSDFEQDLGIEKMQNQVHDTNTSQSMATVQNALHQYSRHNNRSKLRPVGSTRNIHQEIETLFSLLTRCWNSEKLQILKKQLDLMNTLGKKVLQPTVLTVPCNAALEEVHVIFSMLRCNRLYVTNQGQLCGEIMPHHLMKHGERA